MEILYKLALEKHKGNTPASALKKTFEKSFLPSF